MSSVQDIFLSRFNSSMRPEIIEYGKRLSSFSEEKNAVLFFMARKAVCLADCLASLKLSFFSCPITSDRVLELNTEWLQNKKVIVVDDALISGTTLFRTNEKLLQAGIKEENIKNIVLCVNNKWWCPELITPHKPYLELEDNETASLCASIVEAISIVPRPYCVDFPLYRNIRIPANRFDELVVIPGWTVDEVTSPVQRANNVVSLTLTPHEKKLIELDKKLGWNFSENSLVKLRLYGRIIEGKRTIYWCNLLPIIAMKPVPTGLVKNLFSAVLKYYTSQSSELSYSFEASHLTGKVRNTAEICSKLRFVSFIAANALAKLWLSDIRNESISQINLSLYEPSLYYLFSPSVAQIAKTISNIDQAVFHNIDSYSNSNAVHAASTPQNANLKLIDEYTLETRLMDPFINLYKSKEIKARKLVLEYGKAVFEAPEWKNVINRLNIGFSSNDMRSWIAEFSQLFKINMFLSLFLDRAIDRGCIVPIVYEKDGFICRAYRHGEDVEFGQEQERMCAYMLKALAQSSNSSSLVHTIVEKTLVMFLRIGLEQGFFNYWEGKLGDFQSMGIRFSLHGAVGATATEKPYHTVDSCSLTNIMEEHGYISRKEKKDPWSIEDVPQGGVHPNFANKAIQIGSLLGKLVHKEAKGTTYHLNTKDLILIATCLYPKDIAGALAAEIDIATRYICYEKFDYTASGLLELPSESLQDKIKELRSTIFFFAANNGTWKYRSYMAQKPWEIIERVSSSLVTDMIYKMTWDLFWPSEKRKTGDAIPINLKKIISREGLWLYKLLTICLMLEIALLWAQRDSRGESLKKKLKALKECSVNIQTYFPKEKRLLEDIALLEERIVSGKLQLHKLLSYIEKKFVYLIGETRDILAEVDTIATNIGQPEKISYYSNVLHIELTTRHPTRGNLWRRCHKIFHGIRGRARGQEKSVHTYLLEIPRKGLSVPHGLWIAASGPLSHTWLVRLASQILKELGNKAIIRCTLFRDLPDNGLLRRPENSSEFIGPTFWARADLIIHNKLGESNFSELITVVDDSHVDKQEAIRSIRKEANKVVNFTYSSETHHLLEPVPYNVSLYKFPYIQSKKTQIKKVEKMDIGIITVVPDELVAVNQILKKHPNFKERQGELSVRHFYEGNLPAADGKFHSVVCTRAQEQGSRAVMAAYQALAEEYSPTLMVLLGIGGSIHKDIELCDVVFAENIWYYDKRAVTEKGTQRRAISYYVVPWLRNAINRLYDDFGDTPRLPAHNQSTDKKFSVFFGPIGTGEAVIRHRDAEERQWLQKVSDKTLVLETEAGGVAQQFCEDQLRHGFKPQGYLILRGVSDHADKEKDDAWRIPAAANAMLALGKLTSMSKAGFEDKIPKS